MFIRENLKKKTKKVKKFQLRSDPPPPFPEKLKTFFLVFSETTLIKISLLEGRVMTNASALPVQRQVLEQLFITDPKVGFGQAALL